MALLFHLVYYPTRFSERPRIYATAGERRSRLTLPFSSDDYDGVFFPGDVEPPPCEVRS